MTHTDQIIQCNVLEGIPLPDKSVHSVVTSPPYWGLRDYGVAGQLGLEKTPEEYIERMVGVFRHVWRVLRDDGTCWMNMGDSYWGGGWKGSQTDLTGTKQATNVGTLAGKNMTKDPPHEIYKPKDLCMMPARLAIALQADGWYLRSDIIWAKPNPMPESVTDRPTKSHEHIFLLTKSGNPLFWTNSKTGVGVRTQPRGTQGVEGEDWEWVEHLACKGEGCDNKRCVGGKVKISFWQGYDYFYDADAIREPSEYPDDDRKGRVGMYNRQPDGKMNYVREGTAQYPTRNKRDVWSISTEAFPAAHFATFPQKLVEPCIKAGTSEKGCCPECGSPWVRISEPNRGGTTGESWHDHSDDMGKGNAKVQSGTDFKTYQRGTTTGWKPTCKHGSKTSIPCTVYDPFMGSGTVGLVAYKLNRHYVGTELNPEYIEMAEKRLGKEKEKYGLIE